MYPGIEHEDEMVTAFDYCLHGNGGAAPSIDTAMHGLVTAAHVDHLHPDAGIAIATAVDGEELTRKIYGDTVVWVPWRRPGFQLGLDIAQIQHDHPDAIGVMLGGHGITAWGATSDECERNSLSIIGTAARYIETHGKPEPFGAVLDGYEACRSHSAGRRRRRSPRRSVASLHAIRRWSDISPTTRWCSIFCRDRNTRDSPGWERVVQTTSCGPR